MSADTCKQFAIFLRSRLVILQVVNISFLMYAGLRWVALGCDAYRGPVVLGPLVEHVLFCNSDHSGFNLRDSAAHFVVLKQARWKQLF